MRKLLLGALTAVAMVCGAGEAQAQWGRPQPEDPTGLKDAYKDYFKVGVAVNMGNMRNPEEVKLILKEYNSITAENDHKVGQINPSEGVYNWGPADSIANFCRENNIQGRVLIQFIVNKDGSIVDPEVVKSVNPYLDKEALRVISTMPKWTPGKQRGKAVRVKYTVPVNFKLQ